LSSRLGEKEQQIAIFSERLASKDAELARIRSERDGLRSDLNEAKRGLAEVAGRKAAEDEAQTLLRAEFPKIAADVLKANSEAFLGLAQGRLEKLQSDSSGELDTKKAEIEGIVGPMAESLKNLDERVRSLLQSEEGLLTETRELASALKETKSRGSWGELQLKRIAELSGMQERCDFELQKAVTTDENRLLYPDMLVNLPNGRVIVVDSKAVMDAYRESTLTTDPAIRQQKLLDHAKAVRTRVDALASKEYRSHVEGSADFVVCFVPGEAFFSAALAADEGLLEHAARKSVVLASPTTLLSILRAVALGWKEAKLAEDAKEICSLASELYERFRTSAEHVKSLGAGLENALGSYNSFIGSVESRVFPQARRLQKLTHMEKSLPMGKPIEIAARKLAAMDWASEPEVIHSIAAESKSTD